MPSKLNILKGNTVVLSVHAQALYSLQQIGFLDWLEEQGRPYIQGNGSDAQAMATQAARSAGYFECFTNLVEFEDKYYKENKKQEVLLSPDYGGYDLAVEQGYMTKEEADELKRNRPIQS